MINASSNSAFRKADRLLNRTDFLRIAGEGRSVRNRLFVAAYTATNRNNCRLGITVTKKTGGAVTRNRIKRQIREFFRRNRGLLVKTVDINIIARKESAAANHKRIRESLQALFQHISHEQDY